MDWVGKGWKISTPPESTNGWEPEVMPPVLETAVMHIPLPTDFLAAKQSRRIQKITLKSSDYLPCDLEDSGAL